MAGEMLILGPSGWHRINPAIGGEDLICGLTGYAHKIATIGLKFKDASMNNLNQDVAVFTGLPSKYRVESLIAYGPLIPSGTARVQLYRGPNKTGGTVVTEHVVPTALNSTATYPASNTDVLSGNLYLNNTNAAGVAATCSFLLVISDLS